MFNHRKKKIDEDLQSIHQDLQEIYQAIGRIYADIGGIRSSVEEVECKADIISEKLNGLERKAKKPVRKYESTHKFEVPMYAFSHEEGVIYGKRRTDKKST